MAKQTENVLRMPEQHVRADRGEAGYKSNDEGRVEVFKTPNPFQPSSRSSTRKSKADWEAEARAAGIEPTEDDTIATLKEKIAKAGGGDNG